jgi:acetylornithine deacetylase/succinyl-diaminopimelate desuccinylase-like protein
MRDVYDYIDANAGRAVRDLQALLRQPSISAQNIGLPECARLLRDQLVAYGIDDTRIMPTNGGPEVVYSEIAGANAARTLLCYGHYDVQPPEPLERWISPPFAAEIHACPERSRRDGVIIARGATDNKSGVHAFMQAAAAFRAVRGDVPVNLKFVFEGEEEVGSPHFEEWVIDHTDMLACDASIGLDGGVHRTSGKAEIHLGIKAILYVELRVKSHAEDFWSGRAQLLKARSAPWRLVHCLSTIFSPDGEILIDGWYDDWQGPDDDDLYFIREEARHFDRAELAKQFGVRDFPYETDEELLRAIHYGASANICGISAGYTGEGSKTIVPSEAVAKLDFRCPPNLEPADQLAKLKAHLQRNGFDDIEIIVHTARKNPYKTPVREAISQATIRAADIVFGEQPVVMGVSIQGIIKIHVPHPAVLSGFGAPENNLHAPNENMPIARYIQGIKYAATIFDEFSR